jgi:hypothetical protein
MSKVELIKKIQADLERAKQEKDEYYIAIFADQLQRAVLGKSRLLK